MQNIAHDLKFAKNILGVQMIPEPIRNQLFDKAANPINYNQILTNLKKHHIEIKENDLLKAPDINYPHLKGSIKDHFKNIGEKQSYLYRNLCFDFNKSILPPLPSEWKLQAGWTRYSENTFEKVIVPYEDAMIFDVEVCVKDPGFLPTMAIALTSKAWYLWCGPQLFSMSWTSSPSLSKFININTAKTWNNARIIIGHNVGYDRSWIRDEYILKKSGTRFMDTMSLHLACSGLTHLQRISKVAMKQNKSNMNYSSNEQDYNIINSSSDLTTMSPYSIFEGDWERIGSLNSLADIHKLYCAASTQNKTKFSSNESNKDVPYIDSAILKADKLRKSKDDTKVTGQFINSLDVFLNGTLNDVRQNFQMCANYCAKDCLATFDVFKVLFPMFLERFPNPVTLGGMLEMSTAYLPTTKQAWTKFISSCEQTYTQIDQDNRISLARLAKDACTLLTNENYKNDPWLCDLDWSVTKLQLNKRKSKTTSLNNHRQIKNKFDYNYVLKKYQELKELIISMDIDPKTLLSFEEFSLFIDNNFEEWDGNLSDFIDTKKQQNTYNCKDVDKNSQSILRDVLATAQFLPKNKPILAGYPLWYRELCEKMPNQQLPNTKINTDGPQLLRQLNDETCNETRKLGPTLLSSQTRISPKLLRLTWKGWPLYFHPKYKWGYLVPGNLNNMDKDNKKHLHAMIQLPKFREFGDIVETPNDIVNKSQFNFPNSDGQVHFADSTWDEVMNSTFEGNIDDINKNFTKFLQYVKKLDKYKEATNGYPKNGVKNGSNKFEVLESIDNGSGCDDVAGCWYFPLPHKSGPNNRVGNPLSKDFIPYMEDGTLKACSGPSAQTVLNNSKIISYWKNARTRILSQLVVYEDYDNNADDGDINGSNIAMLPNDQISKIKSRDSNFIYGAIVPRLVVCGTVSRRAVEPTWLTASNARADRLGSELKAIIQSPPGYCFIGADVDSQELWIASILGDANNLAAKTHGSTPLGWMTLQGNKKDKTDMHSRTAELIGTSRDEAKVLNYARIYGAGPNFAARLISKFQRLNKEEAFKKAKEMYRATKGKRVSVPIENYVSDSFSYNEPVRKSMWKDGSESDMFNMLETIATSDKPKTPFLESRICRTLEPAAVGSNFMTSRTNWVVQSSAVDFLHLMLVCMKWLMDEYDIEGRFSISIHDEVRYLVTEKDKYRAALALQLTNLYTRAFFSYQLGIYDLPLNVAFFSAVDIDKCLRKEVDTDCVTPSNQEGLLTNYGIDKGEALNIYEIVDKTGGTLSLHK